MNNISPNRKIRLGIFVALKATRSGFVIVIIRA